MRIAIFTLLMLMSFSISVKNELLAEEKEALVTPPHFFYIGSKTGNSVLSMQCEGDKPYKKINCTFTEINIRKPSNRQNTLAGLVISTVMAWNIE